MNTLDGCTVLYKRSGDGKETRHTVRVEALPSGYFEFYEDQDKIFTLGPVALAVFLKGTPIQVDGGTVSLETPKEA